MRNMYCTGWFSQTGSPPFKIRCQMVYGEERLVAPKQPDVERTGGADQGAICHVKLVARHGGQDVAAAVNFPQFSEQRQKIVYLHSEGFWSQWSRPKLIIEITLWSVNDDGSVPAENNEIQFAPLN